MCIFCLTGRCNLSLDAKKNDVLYVHFLKRVFVNKDDLRAAYLYLSQKANKSANSIQAVHAKQWKKKVSNDNNESKNGIEVPTEIDDRVETAEDYM